MKHNYSKLSRLFPICGSTSLFCRVWACFGVFRPYLSHIQVKEMQQTLSLPIKTPPSKSSPAKRPPEGSRGSWFHWNQRSWYQRSGCQPPSNPSACPSKPKGRLEIYGAYDSVSLFGRSLKTSEKSWWATWLRNRDKSPTNSLGSLTWMADVKDILWNKESVSCESVQTCQARTWLKTF